MKRTYSDEFKMMDASEYYAGRGGYKALKRRHPNTWGRSRKFGSVRINLLELVLKILLNYPETIIEICSSISKKPNELPSERDSLNFGASEVLNDALFIYRLHSFVL